MIVSHTPLRRVLPLIATLAAAGSLSAQTTGWNQTGSGPFEYLDAGNWVGGEINGIWDSSLTVTSTQTVFFEGDTVLSTGFSFAYVGGSNLTLRAEGGASTLTLGGDIDVFRANNGSVTLGSTTGSQNLNVDLGGTNRTFRVTGARRGSDFGQTLRFLNTVSNGSVTVSGQGTGGGEVQFGALSNTLDALTIEGAEVFFNGTLYNTGNAVNTVTGALTAASGMAFVTAQPRSNRHMLVEAGSFVREAGGTILFRADSLGVNTAASQTVNSANVMFDTAPALSGGGGAAGTTTISILAGALGDTSSSGSGFGATGGLVTYDADRGVRLLDTATEYTAAIADGQTQLDNVRYANSSGVPIVTTLTGSTRINSLSFDVTGSTGNQGVTIQGDPGTTLTIASGVISAYQNVTTAGSPALTDAMTLDVPVLDFNGQEGIFLLSTRMNTGGTVQSNAGLNINSAITNANGLTFANGFNTAGFVVLGGDTANTYSGTATVNGAVVKLAKSIDNATIVGDLVINGGSVYDGGNEIADTSNVFIRGGTLYLNGSNNSGSATDETINDLTMSGGAVSSGQGSGNVLNILGNATLTGGTVNGPTAGRITVSGSTTLAGGVLSIGRSSAATYNAKASLAGPLQITNTASGAYTPITIAAANSISQVGGQLELSGDVNFTGNLTNANTVTIAAPVGVGPQGVVALDGDRTFTVGDGAADVDLTVEAGVIDGTSTGGLVKAGAGTLLLGGENAFTGATTVNAGTLLIDGSSVSAVTVNGGVLGGTGSIGNSVSIGNSGTLAPGNSPGTIGTGDLSLTGAAATIAMEIGGTGAGEYDQVAVTGAVSLDGNGRIEITLLSFVPQPTDLFFLVVNDGVDAIDGTLFGIAQGETFTSGGYTWQVSYIGDSVSNTFTGGNDLALQMVPEPGTALLATCGLMAVLKARRRRV